MAKILTTEDLIETSLRRAMIPSDQSTFTCEDIREILNEELGIHVVPMVLRAHEEYLVIDEDQVLVACTVRYKIPYRAVGNKLRDVQIIDSAGNYVEMTRVSLEDRPFNQGNYQNSLSGGHLTPFYVENDDVVLVNNKISNGNLRMSFYLRPNCLVDNSRGGTITAICVGACTTTFTMDIFPTHFSTTTCFDFVQGKSPNKITAFDRAVTSSSSTLKTITFNNCALKTIDMFSTTPTAITFSIGDVITKSEESIMPQLPTELHPILAQRVAVKMLEALGDTQGMQNAQKELERMEYNAMTLIDNRVEGSPMKIVNRNSILRNSLSNKLFRRGSY